MKTVGPLKGRRCTGVEGTPPSTAGCADARQTQRISAFASIDDSNREHAHTFIYTGIESNQGRALVHYAQSNQVQEASVGTYHDPNDVVALFYNGLRELWPSHEHLEQHMTHTHEHPLQSSVARQISPNQAIQTLVTAQSVQTCNERREGGYLGPALYMPVRSMGAVSAIPPLPHQQHPTGTEGHGTADCRADVICLENSQSYVISRHDGEGYLALLQCVPGCRCLTLLGLSRATQKGAHGCSCGGEPA